MRFAINMPNFGDFGYPHRLAELAQEAEEAGWDGFFVCQEVPSTTIPLVRAPWWRRSEGIARERHQLEAVAVERLTRQTT